MAVKSFYNIERYICVFLSLFTAIVSNFYTFNRSFPIIAVRIDGPKVRIGPPIRWRTDPQSESGFNVAFTRYTASS